MKRFLCFLLLAPFVLLHAGCQSRGGSIALDTRDSQTLRTERFSHAYISNVRSGEYDIVFVDNAQDWDYQRKADRPLEPIAMAPLRQVMHIHLYWRPLTGTTSNPAAINASINWYILGADGTNDLLVYEGAGYVTVRGSGKTRTIDIRDGRIKPKVNRGDMQDPIGPARISGEVVARVNDSRVRETIDEMKQIAGPQ